MTAINLIPLTGCFVSEYALKPTVWDVALWPHSSSSFQRSCGEHTWQGTSELGVLLQWRLPCWKLWTKPKAARVKSASRPFDTVCLVLLIIQLVAVDQHADSLSHVSFGEGVIVPSNIRRTYPVLHHAVFNSWELW